MGETPTEFPQLRPPAEPWPPRPMYVPPVPAPPSRSRAWLALVLLALTMGSTTLLHGPWYSAAILAILGAHEMGHSLACRYYRIDASLPYFLPMPLVLTGTLGAFIRIRQQIPSKRQLFDIGIAGPIAGFVVLIPILFAGAYFSNVIPLIPGEGVVWLGEPLLYKAAVWFIHGPLPDGYTTDNNPLAFAAWFGMLATALNLFPIGQLDGGHISYAVLGPRSTQVTVATVLCLIGLSFFSLSWIVWTFLTVMMLIAFGPRHPRTFDEEVPLDRPRLALAGFAVLMFVLCFTPAPIEPLDFVSRPAEPQNLQEAQRIDVDRDATPDLGHLR